MQVRGQWLALPLPQTVCRGREAGGTLTHCPGLNGNNGSVPVANDACELPASRLALIPRALKALQPQCYCFSLLHLVVPFRYTVLGNVQWGCLSVVSMPGLAPDPTLVIEHLGTPRAKWLDVGKGIKQPCAAFIWHIVLGNIFLSLSKTVPRLASRHVF